MASLGTINKAYVSAIDSMLDTREINKMVTDIANEDQLTDILEFGDRKKPTKQSVYYNFVNEPLFKLVTATAVSAGQGTTTITIILDALTSGIARPGDLVKFKSAGEPVGQVQSVTTTSSFDSLVIKSVDGVTNLSITTNDKLSLFSYAAGEGAVSPQNIRFGLTKYSNKVQIFRETSLITDVQNASTIEVEFNGQPSFVVKDHIEKAVKIKGNINAAYFGGVMSSTTFSDASPALVDQNSITGFGGSGAVQTTRGLDPYVTAYGVNTKANAGVPNGSVLLADVDSHLDAMTANRCPRSYFVGAPKGALRGYDKLFKNLGSAGVTSVRLALAGKEGEMDLTVQKVTYGSYELNFGWLPILDNPALFSQVSVGKSAYFIPVDKKVKVEGGGYQSAIQVRYFPDQHKYGNDIMGEIHTGALNPTNPNGPGDYWRMDFVTTQGLEVLGAQFFAKQQVLA